MTSLTVACPAGVEVAGGFEGEGQLLVGSALGVTENEHPSSLVTAPLWGRGRTPRARYSHIPCVARIPASTSGNSTTTTRVAVSPMGRSGTIS